MVMAAAVSAKISDIFFRRNSALQEEVGNISGDNGNDDFCDNQRQNRAAISRWPDEDQIASSEVARNTDSSSTQRDDAPGI